MLVEQTEIAKQLGLSNKSFRRIVYHAKLPFKILAKKRHYHIEEFLELIKKESHGKAL
jgi:hypothetical protein